MTALHQQEGTTLMVMSVYQPTLALTLLRGFALKVDNQKMSLLRLDTETPRIEGFDIFDYKSAGRFSEAQVSNLRFHLNYWATGRGNWVDREQLEPDYSTTNSFYLW
jgi:hypothetical protein